MEAVSSRRGRGLLQCVALLAALACIACSDEPDAGADSEAGSGGSTQSGGSGAGGSRAGGSGAGGAGGSSAPTGSAGGSGSGSPRAGASGGAGSGVDASDGGGGGDGGASPDPAGAGGDGGDAGSGSGGSGKAGTGGWGADFPTDLEGSCTTDADCELCTAPLGIGGDCCPGCPIVTSKEICAELAAAFDACGPSLPLCPVPSCLFPGSPACGTEGKCVMGDGIQQ